MASVTIVTYSDLYTEVDYSIVDGRVTSFTLHGDLLYDEMESVAIDGWKEALVAFVQDHGLDRDDGRGLHAFVYRMIEDGLIRS